MNHSGKPFFVGLALAGIAALANPFYASGKTVRIAEFNVALYGEEAGEVRARLASGDDARVRRIAEIIQRVRPDVLMLSEVDYDPSGELVDLFCTKYLAVGQHTAKGGQPTGGSDPGPAEPIEFPHRFAAPTNTGFHSGFDLDRNGRVDATPGTPTYGGDCWGFGVYPGQYAFAILSRYPLDEAGVRTFKNMRWRDMPGAELPDNAETAAPADWYSAEILEQFPLSSKNHCDVPVVVDGVRVHLLACHPTPPTFDAAENRNGRRNHDELRLWADYVGAKGDGRMGGEYIVDDQGEPGGLPPGESFILLGDLNGDPHDGEGSAGIAQILASPRVLKYPAPTSAGGVEQSRRQAGANREHSGDPASDTCDPADNPGPGNLRLDYILPSADLAVAKSGVFWPATRDPLFALTAGSFEPASSDHRLVWADVVLPDADPSGAPEAK